MEHATWPARIVLFVFSAIIIAMILSAQRGRQLFIRRIPGLTAIDEAIGRAAEMGRPAIASFGLGGIDIVTLQALAIISNVAKAAAQFGTRVILPVSDAAVLPIAEDTMRDAYSSAGRPDLFSEENVRFLAGSQFAYAAGVTGIIHRENAASMFLFGTFFAEALIMAENGNRVGAIQVAGTPSTTQIPFFIAACDYVIIGDEFYAATAYITRQPTLLGSLVGQDIVKGILLLLIVLGALLLTLNAPVIYNFFEDKDVPIRQYMKMPQKDGGAGG